MKFAHLLASFYFEPWNLRPDFHSNFGRVLQSILAGQPAPEAVQQRPQKMLSAARSGRPIVGPTDDFGNPLVPQMAVEGSVAVIPAWGVLGKNLSRLDLLCGGADYAHLSEFARMAYDEPGVQTVIIDFDTPGGSTRGLPECASVFDDLAARKHLVAYSEGLCCSAGYFLACSASEFYASPSASVGNIGTVLAALDNSREWEMKGWRLELFASGALKGAGFDGKSWTDEERGFFQSWMEKKFLEFVAVVQRARPQLAEEFFDGRWLDGDIAPAAGLSDGVCMSLEKLVSVALAGAVAPAPSLRS